MLASDASDEALGLVLQQEQDGMLKVIAYTSRALHPAERSYYATRKELLAVIYELKNFLAEKAILLLYSSRGADISVSNPGTGGKTGEISRPVGRVRHCDCSPVKECHSRIATL